MAANNVNLTNTIKCTATGRSIDNTMPNLPLHMAPRQYPVDFKDPKSRAPHFQHVSEMIELAVDAGGQVFGGFVRDVIIPLMVQKRPIEELSFNDVDI